ncbi:MAG: 6-carboxytetrahydropterin synthase [Gammaproteobacteria bacterium]
MKRLTTIELQKENMKFSAGHFTIFSATERENLHGHNYNVFAALTTWIDDDIGLSFDYRYYKRKLVDLCRELNQAFLIPANSKFLQIETSNEYTYIHFNDERIPFLPRDIKLIPVTNITVEELAQWFIDQLLQNEQELQANAIQKINIKVFSAPGQSGSAQWEKSDA